MDDRRESIFGQWVLLFVLTGAHFVVDCFPGLMHTLLPRIQTSFGLSIARGGILLTIFLLACNGIQVLIGHRRAEKTRPMFMYIGFSLTAVIGAIAFLPRTAGMFGVIAALLVLCGVGVGMTHPEMLRALHKLGGISSAVGTSVFMAGGVGGFAFGGWISTSLVERWDFAGLGVFCVLAVLAAAALAVSGVRLAVEKKEDADCRDKSARLGVSFWPVFVMAVLAGLSTAALIWAAPQILHDAGFALTKGGMSVMLFSLSGGLGGMLVARYAARRGELLVCGLMLAAGLPFAAGYAMWVRQGWAMWLLAAAGLLCYGAYPIMVSLARQSRGGNLGRRMGLMVGGTWLIASFVPMLLGPVAQAVGLRLIIALAPAGYAVSAMLIGYVLLKKRKAGGVL